NIDQSYRCILSPLIRVTNDLWIDIDDEAFFNLIKSHLINRPDNFDEIKESYNKLKKEMHVEIELINANRRR
ncbi:MAG: hypothetical protein LBF27_05075, partial [Sphingobacterium sp.]|nr:hypothetical protein [Sphingobacterium sp.]